MSPTCDGIYHQDPQTLSVFDCLRRSSEPTSYPAAEKRLGIANSVMTDGGVVAFLGLPFAEAPVGDKRFKPPVAVDSWDGPLDTSDRPVMIFNTTDPEIATEVGMDPASDERSYWDGVPFDGVVPTSKPEDL